MSAPWFLLFGLIVGVVVGWPLEKLDAKPIVRSVLAMQLGVVFAAFGCGVAWMIETLANHGVSALTFGFAELVVTIVPVVVVAAGIHALLGRVATEPGSLLLRKRAMILGGDRKSTRLNSSH